MRGVRGAYFAQAEADLAAGESKVIEVGRREIGGIDGERLILVFQVFGGMETEF